ncbi:hypothetical protein H0H93_008169 [Arthromyces matolae]|nr:hypothetical protein H0H93_008169 [Arthromyces matolae]
MTTQTTEIRWGIISTGNIAACFVKDLLVDPKTRDVFDVVHKVTAIGSRSIPKAREFINTVAGGDSSIKAYGTYNEVYADKDVDAIYIGTPHTYHYENALDAIKAGKHILCEKPVTSNSAELRSLLAAAKTHNVFFMEAMWTRFQPLVLEVKKIAEEGSLGAPAVLHADLSGDFNIHSELNSLVFAAIQNSPDLETFLKPTVFWTPSWVAELYSICETFFKKHAIVALYENPRNKLSRFTNVNATMLKTPLTNVDQNTSFTVTFAGADLAAQAIMSCSINLNAISPGVIIRFERGTITIPAPIYCPKEFKVSYFGEDGKIIKEDHKTFEYVGGGWHFQADEVARCVRDGKKESGLWGHDKSLLEMEVFDEVSIFHTLTLRSAS